MATGSGLPAAEGPTEVEILRRCLADVVALSTLSAVWAGHSRPEVAASLVQVLEKTLGADVVCVCLRPTATAPACDATAQTEGADDEVGGNIRARLAGWLRETDASRPLREIAGVTAAHIVTPIGIYAEHGVIVTVARHAGFPSDIDRLLLNVAANQATLALLTHTARDEQRIADTLQRVGTSVAAELDPEKVVQTVTDEATALTGADFGAFFYNVTNAAGESYLLYTLAGAPREAFSRFPMPRNTAIFAPDLRR